MFSKEGEVLHAASKDEFVTRRRVCAECPQRFELKQEGPGLGAQVRAARHVVAAACRNLQTPLRDDLRVGASRPHRQGCEACLTGNCFQCSPGEEYDVPRVEKEPILAKAAVSPAVHVGRHAHELAVRLEQTATPGEQA